MAASGSATEPMNHAYPDLPSPGYPELPDTAGEYRTVFEVAYRNRRQDLLRLLRHFGVSHADAEDIAQDVFVKAIAPAGPAPGNLFAWLVTCAKNLARKRHHRANREITLTGEQWHVWAARSLDSRATAHTELEQKERVRAVRRAIAQLDRMEAECLVLRSRGLTFREIGERLGIPLRRASYLATTALEKVEASVQEWA